MTQVKNLKMTKEEILEIFHLWNNNNYIQKNFGEWFISNYFSYLNEPNIWNEPNAAIALNIILDNKDICIREEEKKKEDIIQNENSYFPILIQFINIPDLKWILTPEDLPLETGFKILETKCSQESAKIAIKYFELGKKPTIKKPNES